MKTTIKQIDFTKVNHDVNGNPRHVCHFTALINEGDRIKADHKNGDMFGISTQYEIALKKARELGGRKYHNKQYGGGIVFQTYNTHDTNEQINAIKNVNIKFIQDWEPFNKLQKKVEKAIYTYFTTHTHKMLLEHGKPLVSFKPFNFEQIDNFLGLAYTSSGAYAGLWACNGGYLMANDTHHFIGFVINELGKVVAIVEDENEHQIFIEL